MKLSCVFSAAAAGFAAIFLMGASSCEEALANPDKFFNEEVDQTPDRKSTRLNSSHSGESRMPSSA